MTDLAPDARAHRDWLLSFVSVPDAALVVDLGCGAGHDLAAMALAHPGAAARFIGLDTSEKAIACAQSHSNGEPRISFRRHDLNGRLPFESATVDAVFTSNLLECLADPGWCAAEIGRILRPGGLLVAAHWDWDSQMFDGSDKARNRRLVHAFADWQQAWMEHCDGWMGRRLWGVFAPHWSFRRQSAYARPNQRCLRGPLVWARPGAGPSMPSPARTCQRRGRRWTSPGANGAAQAGSVLLLHCRIGIRRQETGGVATLGDSRPRQFRRDFAAPIWSCS